MPENEFLGERLGQVRHRTAALFQAGFIQILLKSLVSHSSAFFPQGMRGHLGWLRGALGAGLAIILSALVTWLVIGTQSAALPWLVAPLGASAVLVFAVPASPLAQPWPVVGGNLISAAIGIGIGMSTGSAMLAPGLAVGAAITVMTFTRCLHPPGGASALLCALGAAGGEAWTWTYLLPIAANVLTLALVGLIYNNLTGHSWPHRAPLPVSNPALAHLHHTRTDIEDVLAEWEEVLDVDVDDLDALLREVNRRVARREIGRR